MKKIKSDIIQLLDLFNYFGDESFISWNGRSRYYWMDTNVIIPKGIVEDGYPPWISQIYSDKKSDGSYHDNQRSRNR